MQHKPKHVVQSPEWSEFKNAYGTKSVQCGELFYTIHKIPFTPHFVAYCPKVDPFVINWEDLTKSLKKNGCVSINFDCPNILTTDTNYSQAKALVSSECTKTPKDTFAKNTVILDLKDGEEGVIENMHPKHRYNIKLAEKHGVIVDQAETLQDFDVFFQMLHDTAEREKYYIHSKRYYQGVWETLQPKGMCQILTAKLNGRPLSAWMLFIYQGVLYYPYGASSGELKNICHGNLLGWEAIKLGIKSGCTSFDMWGAANNPNDTNHPWWGFTNFKLKYGGKLVEFMDSYDYVVNPTVYSAFNFTNKLRWKILRLIR